MKKIAIVFAISAFAISLGLSFAANAQTRDPPAAAAAPAAPAKKKEAKEGIYCKWKGGDFSAGAEFCVFSGRAMLCENGVWKHEDLTACVVTPAVLP